MLRPRFSLLNALFLVTTLGIALALWRTHSELVPLREEVQRLRNEAGYLNIEDRNLLHVAGVRTDNPLAWRWKFYLPTHSEYRLCCNIGRLPQEGKSPVRDSSTHELRCAPSQYRTETPRRGSVAIYRNAANQLEIKQEFWGRTSIDVLSDVEQRIIGTSTRSPLLDAAWNDSMTPGKPFILLKQERWNNDDLHARTAGHNGIVIWVEEIVTD